MEIWEQLVNAVIIGVMVALTLGVHFWWWRVSQKLSEDWSELCKNQNDRWVEHIQRIDNDWSEKMKKLNEDWRELSSKMLQEQAEARERLNEAWQDAVLSTMDRIEDRYFKYTMKVTDARRPPRERS